MEQTKFVVLAIDDIEDNLISLKAVIKDVFAHASVFTANNGIAGIEIAKRINPDVILLDIIMPGMDGFTTCQKLKADPDLQIIPVIFITALKSDSTSRIKALEIGADGFLTKPINEQELIAQIRAMVKLKTAEVFKLTERERLVELVEFRTRELVQNQQTLSRMLEELQQEMQSRKRSDAALQESELRLRVLINSMPDIVCFKDGAGRWLEANQSDLQLFQIEGVDYFGKTDSELAEFSPFYREAFLTCEASDEETWKAGKITTCEERIPQQDGIVKTLEVIKVPIYETDGSRKGLIVVGHDISERVKNENNLQRAYQISELLVEDLRKSENLIQKIFDLLPVGLWIADEKGKLLSSNAAAIKIWGGNPLVPMEEYGVFKAFRLPSRQEVVADDWALAHSVEEGVTIVDELLEIHAFDGEKRVVLNYTAPVFDEHDRVEAAFVIVQDITEKFRNEMILKLQSNIARAVVSTADLSELFAVIRQELAVLFDTTNFIYAVYDAETDMLFSPFETDVNGVIVDTWKADRSLTGYMLKQKKSMLLNEAELAELDASGVVEIVGAPALCWMGVPLFKGNQVSGAVIVQSYENNRAYDAKSLEVMEIIAHEMSIYIERKTTEEELIKAKEKAEESDRLKTGFLQNMSHEIRTPMHGILGFASLLEQDGIKPEDIKEFSSYIRISGNRMMELINNILDVTKIESGVIEISEDIISLNKLMSDLFSLSKPLCDVKSLELISTYIPTFEDVIFKSDELKIIQIMTNLVGNAIKFTAHGRVEFGCHITDSILHFRVKDTGCGISEVHIPRVFDRFYQADMSIARGFEGAGLGLSICLGLVNCLIGEIHFETEVGVGSEFSFFIPVKSEGIPVSDPPEVPSTGGNRAWNILVAEDDDVNFYYVQAVLTSHQIQVLRAANGQEAIEMVILRPDIDLVLMDVKMPIMNGVEATKKIKQLRPDLPVVIQTAYAFENEKSVAYAAGCDEYLTKPIKSGDLLQCLATQLNQDIHRT
jgi:PAS domain S-box-containing protein